MPITLTRVESGIYHSVWDGDISYEDMIAARHEAMDIPKANGDDHFVILYEFHDVHIPEFSFGNFNMGMMRRLMDETKHIVYDYVIFIGLSGGAKLAISTYHRLFKGLGHNDYYVKDFDSAIKKARSILERVRPEVVD